LCVLVVVRDAWRTTLGALRFTEDGPVLDPDGAVTLNGQRVAVSALLVRGDRVERGAAVLRVLAPGE
jgi:hypothetical protein